MSAASPSYPSSSGTTTAWPKLRYVLASLCSYECHQWSAAPNAAHWALIGHHRRGHLPVTMLKW